MKPIKRINIKAAINKIKYTKNGKICVVDEENTLRIYSLNDYRLIGGFRIKLPKNRPLENGVDISENGKYLAIAVNGKKKTSIWDIENKKQMFLLRWHRGDVLSVSFDKEEKYLLTGGEDGRSYLWSLATGKMVSALPPSADYVISSDFSLNSLWAAVGSYDKNIIITNITSIDISFRKKAHKGAVTKLKFASNQHLFSGDKNGGILIWNYTKGTILKRLPSLSDRVIDMCIDKENKFLFACAEKKVSLYSLEDYTKITDEFIKLSSIITSIEYIDDKNYLILGTMDGDIYIYDLLLEEKELKALILDRKYAKAYEMVSKNPFLKFTQTYLDLENEWEKTLKKAYKYLENGEINIAKELLTPFFEVPSKRIFIQNLLKDFREFEKFKNAVLNLRYPLAYSLAAQYPSFKDTVYYKQMEENWKKVFNLAKKFVLKDGNLEKAREILKPFRGVSQKAPLIQALFSEKQLYDFLREKLAKKDFREFFLLIKRYPFLIETEEYEKAMKLAKNIERNIELLLKRGDYKKVISFANTLREFPGYEEKAKRYEEEAKVLMDFQRLIANRDYELIFEYVKKYPFLEEVNDYKELQNLIKSKISVAENYAAKGDVERILKSVGDLLDIREYSIRIANLIKSAYLHQIISLLVEKLKGKKNDELIKKGIKNYISLFGFDLEIKDMIEKAKRLKIEIDLEGVEEGDIYSIFKKKIPLKIYEF